MSSLLTVLRKKGAAAFAPTDLTSLAAWYDANDITTLWQDSARTTQVSADGQGVGAWDDKSGNANHLTQGTGANEPLYKTGILNSLPVLRFDGSNDSLGASLGALGTPITVFVVCYFVTNVDTMYVYSIGTAGWLTANSAFSFYNNSGGGGEYGWWDGGASLLGDSLPAAKTWMQVTQRLNSSSTYHEAWLDTATLNPSDNDAAISTDGELQLGVAGNRTSPLQGDIAEFILYSAALSNANKSQVETYLNDKWAIY